MEKWSKTGFFKKLYTDDQRIPEPPEEAIAEVLK